MHAHEKLRDGLTIFLHLFTSQSCIRKRFIFYPGEKKKIEIEKETLGTVFPVIFVLEKAEEHWLLDGAVIPEKDCAWINTDAGEEILLVLSGRNRVLMPCGRIPLHGRQEIRIGKAFQNEVFYECYSYVKERHICLVKEGDNYVLVCPFSSEKENIYAYINGKAAEEKQLLRKGDRIDLMGLSMIFFPNLLVCSAFYGTLRTAERKEEMIRLLNCVQPVTGENVQGKDANTSVEDVSHGMEGEIFHVEALELYLPEPQKVMDGQPLFLTAGPAMTMVLPMAMTAMLGSRLYGGAGYYQISLVMTVASASLSLFWGVVNHRYRKWISRKEEIKRKEDYRRYLKETESYLADCFHGNQKIMLRKYPSCHQLISEEERRNFRQYKSPRQQDYLFVRLGLGDVPFQVEIHFSGGTRQSRDVLGKEAYALADKYKRLTQVPVGIDLRQISCIGLAGESCEERVLPILIQLAACHDSRDLKIAYFYHQERENESRLAECMKWMPQVWLKGGRIRLLAGNEQEAGEILPGLTKELQQEETEQQHKKCFYVVIISNEQLVKGETLNSLLLDEKAKGWLCTVFLQKRREFLPGDCQYIVLEQQGQEEIICCQKESEERQKMLPDQCAFGQVERYMRNLSGLVMGEDGENGIPQKVSFLDLYGCQTVEELNCGSRWGQNQTGERMKVPIGMGAGGRLIYLDIHEKFHGPHGLMAGTTGAGKSELLQTYLLSLAVSFSPEEVNFFIIDYKGGGMGNTLCQLPHCAGVISNLSGRQIKRALASIKSENTRRQMLFCEAGVNHVEDYARLYKEEKVALPVPHLLLVIDEFAELRREEPDFMKEIISVSQVGRSLGVHLILATQKPAGTVDDKIWSNTRFRLCLRVADRQDSLDMLHRPEAAYLIGAGRGYLQVGNNELYELFQAGYSGAPCTEKDAQNKRAAIVSLTGKRFEGSKEKSGKLPIQLQAVSDYIKGWSEQLGYEKARELWMPELPETLFLEEVVEDEQNHDVEKTEIRVCLGKCDDPERQSQYPMYYTPPQEGHLCLCGAPAVGKSTFLQTLLWQLCQNYEAAQVQFVLAVSDNAGVNCFEEMPHCLGNLKNKRDSECFFHHMDQLLQERKKLLQGIHFQQYRKHKEEAGAYIFLVIDNYSSFRQMTEDRYEDFIERLAAEGIGYGIYLVITSLGVSPAEIPARLFEKIKVSMSLEMSDKFQYGDILRQYQLSVLPRENVKGRGLARVRDKILEFQVPLVGGETDDYERIRRIETAAERLNENTGKPCQKFSMIPTKNIYQTMINSFFMEHNVEKNIPIGYMLNCGKIRALPVKAGFTFLISGAEGSGKRNLLKCIMEGMKQRNIQPFWWEKEGFVKWYWEGGEDRCLCIPNLSEFVRAMEQNEEETVCVRKHMEESAMQHRMVPIIALHQPGKEASLAGSFLYELLRKREWGIHLGGNAGNQRMLSFEDLSFTQMNQKENPGIGYLKTGVGSSTERIFIPLYE